MQSIKKITTHRLRKVPIIVGALVVLVISYAATAYAAELWPFNTSTGRLSYGSGDTDTRTQKSADNDTITNDTPAPSTTSTVKGTPVDNNTQQANGTVSIPFAQQNDNTLQITTLITGIESSGTCTLTLTKESTVIVLPPVGIQAGPNSSTCQGFNVSISSQPQLTAGTWSISIAVESSSVKASATRKVTIK